MNGLLSRRNGPSPSSGHNSVCKKAKLYGDTEVRNPSYALAVKD